MDFMLIVKAVAVLGIMGAVFGAVLAFAAKIFYVEVDPKQEAVRECLAGANCGGCGYPGCDGYAAAVAAGKAPVNCCVAGGAEAAEKIADLPFPYTSLSLNETCVKNMQLLEQALLSQGCEFGPEAVSIVVRKPEPVAWEQSFEGLVPVDKVVLKKRFNSSVVLEFTGNSIVVEGSVVKTGHSDEDYVARIAALLDDEVVEVFAMPYDYIKRKYEIFSRYCFPSGQHRLELRLLNPHPDFEINAQEMVVYAAVK